MREFKKGFTLIEIMITLGILSITFAMSLSILNSISVSNVNKQYIKEDVDSISSIITEVWQLRFGGEEIISIHCDNPESLSLWAGAPTHKVDEVKLKYVSCQNTITDVHLPNQSVIAGEVIQPFLLAFNMATVSVNKFGYATFLY